MSSDDQIRLHIPEEVGRLMEGRAISREDAEKVIRHAEETGEKFVSPANGHSLASYRPGRVTYWVEYSGESHDFIVYTAYSHRMEAKRGRGL
jgi:hypothetical protein